LNWELRQDFYGKNYGGMAGTMADPDHLRRLSGTNQIQNPTAV
jgi:hypothetical protein